MKRIISIIIAMILAMSLFAISASAMTLTVDLDNTTIEELEKIQEMIDEKIEELKDEDESNNDDLESRAWVWAIAGHDEFMANVKSAVPAVKDYFLKPDSIELNGFARQGIDTFYFDISAMNRMGGYERETYLVQKEGSRWTVGKSYFTPSSVYWADGVDLEWVQSLF